MKKATKQSRETARRKARQRPKPNPMPPAASERMRRAYGENLGMLMAATLAGRIRP